MILRNIARRDGRHALGVTARRCVRCASTDAQSVASSIDNHIKETRSIKAHVNALNVTKESKLGELKSTGDDVVSIFNASKHIQKETGMLGSIRGPFYQPRNLLRKSPSPKDITLELLMASQAHLGHSTSIWNPANQRYIEGIRQGIHIISLEVTAAHLRRAAKVVEGVAYHGGVILFVGTRPGQDVCVVRAAQMTQGCHLFSSWIPGTITNRNQILANTQMRAVDENDNDIESPIVREKLVEATPLKPDLVVCLNPLENYICLHECGLHNIPTIGVIDTDADPTWVTYPIPANDDSIRAIQLIAGVLGRAGQAGQKKRMAAAAKGETTWTSNDIIHEWIANDEAFRRAQQEAEEEENDALLV